MWITDTFPQDLQSRSGLFSGEGPNDIPKHVKTLSLLFAVLPLRKYFVLTCRRSWRRGQIGWRRLVSRPHLPVQWNFDPTSRVMVPKILNFQSVPDSMGIVTKVPPQWPLECIACSSLLFSTGARAMKGLFRLFRLSVHSKLKAPSGPYHACTSTAW